MQQQLTYFFRKKLAFRLLLASALLITSLVIHHFNHIRTEQSVTACEKALHEKEAGVRSVLNDCSQYLKTHTTQQLFTRSIPGLQSHFKQNGIVYLIYENDSLQFWSDNGAGVENYIKDICLNNPLVHLKNGIYEVVPHSENSLTKKQLYGLILLKHEYNYQNKYLQNTFFKDFQLPAETKISFPPLSGSPVIHSSEGKPLFSVVFPKTLNRSGILLYLCFFLFLFSATWLIFLLQPLFLPEEKAGSGSVMRFAFFTALLFLCRTLLLWFHFPSFFYETVLYDPTLFGNAHSFYFGYLGDVLMNTLLLLYLSFLFFKKFHCHSTTRNIPVIVFILLLLLLFYGHLINEVFHSLIQNSSISFNVSNLFSLTAFSILGFFVLALLLLSYFLFSLKITSLFSLLSQKNIFLLSGLALFIFVLFSIYEGLTVIVTCWPPIVFLFVYRLSPRSSFFSLGFGLLFVLLFSLITSDLLLRFEGKKEFENRMVYAEKLANQRDEVAENLFADISNKLKSDSRLKSLLAEKPVNAQEIEQRLRQIYFGGYWENFQLSLSVVDSVCLPLLPTNNPLQENNAYFDEQINLQGTGTLCPDLFYIRGLKNHIRYIARVPVLHHANAKKPFLIYVEIEPKTGADIIGYPELLLDKSVKTNRQFSDYSYAVYKNRQLVQRFGKYPFATYYDFQSLDKDYAGIRLNGFHHLVYRHDEETVVIVSKEDTGFWYKFTTNSYFFMFYSSLLLILILLKDQQARKHRLPSSMHIRLQVLMVSIVFISLLGFGAGTVIFIKKQTDLKNTAALEEKMRPVLAELQNSLGAEEFLRANYKEYTAYLLKKMSIVFSSDINMFDLQGNLYASSQPRLFDEGIISRKINPAIYSHVVADAFTNMVIRENIGEMNYYSAYQPFYNKNGKLLAYVNLPYFARQDVLEKEISVFIVALINIYVILFALGTFVALFISNLVTKPLRLIQQRLSEISFGRHNEPIQWEEKDEIGNLIQEYNRMIVQLEESAEKLARSERESAWREMARQVAHEIKNPLTPMKLSIQHLQRTLDTDDTELKGRVKTLSVMLIDQIDTLSHIANEFSLFAQLPKPRSEKLNLPELIPSIISLFSMEPTVAFHFNNLCSPAAHILADKEQLKRIFINLFKNAIQAIPPGISGIIQVVVKKEGDNIIASIKDNGTGISPEAADKIFMPNFSTKTDGMGLGLAMVKNMMESVGGKIWFDTEPGKGTTFYLAFPEYS